MEAKFSNESGTHLAVTGQSYTVGMAKPLHGLDATNDKSFSRNIVLHKSNDVPYEEQNNQIEYSFAVR
jgi:hypothetical protein